MFKSLAHEQVQNNNAFLQSLGKYTVLAHHLSHSQVFDSFLRHHVPNKFSGHNHHS